jgi:hypothetical protein
MSGVTEVERISAVTSPVSDGKKGDDEQKK